MLAQCWTEPNFAGPGPRSGTYFEDWITVFISETGFNESSSLLLLPDFHANGSEGECGGEGGMSKMAIGYSLQVATPTTGDW